MPKYKIKVVSWEINWTLNSISNSFTINPNTHKDGGDEIEFKFKSEKQFKKFLCDLHLEWLMNYDQTS